MRHGREACDVKERNSKEISTKSVVGKTQIPEKKSRRQSDSKETSSKTKPQDILLDKWKERCEVTTLVDVEVESMPEFLDHLKETYDGIDGPVYKELKKIDWKSSKWTRYMFDVKPENQNETEAKFALLLFVKDKEKNSISCAIANYRLSIDVSEAFKDRINPKSLLYSFLRWNIENEESFISSGGEACHKRFKNLFLVKCIEGLQKEGINVDIR